ncbi:hypothetical protein IFU39_16675 [Paenibacillus sp. CFBP 13594]|uniref:hypothetical protein n=1 Tax=Paenibacillus sp. CFBP 13594 TaxID=2774037 RepID=UPI0017866852|nr:hypothetical protein [Paenibacillus sp. CFBP 13594]MBD8839449.1 hypothetical protein [Paenibacillus sp. CFBP 13594]
MCFILYKKPQEEHWQLYSQEGKSREQALVIVSGLKSIEYEAKLLTEDKTDHINEAEEAIRKFKLQTELNKIEQILRNIN